jgi:CHAT domain-containing protein/tetratricopeptide (TPR) repeat protein
MRCDFASNRTLRFPGGALLLLLIAVAAVDAQPVRNPKNDRQIIWKQANAAFARGDFPAAIKAAERVIELDAIIHGKDNSVSIDTYHFIADAQARQRDYAKADTADEAGLALARKCFPADHYRVIDMRRYQAHHRKMAALREADRQRVDATFKSGANASQLAQQRKFPDAVRIMKEVLATRQELLGEDDFETENALIDLAQFHRSADDSEAESASKQLVAVRKKSVGDQHPGYFSSVYNLGHYYRKHGNLKAAEPLYLEALRGTEKVSGKESPDHASCLAGIAVFYKEKRDLPAAEQAATEALAVRKKLLGTASPAYYDSLIVLSQILEARGQRPRSLPYVAEALELARKLQGETSNDYVLLLNTLAVHYADVGEYARAEKLYKDALERQKALSGESTAYATTMNNLGRLYVSMGDRTRAEPLLVQSVEIMKRFSKERPLSYALKLQHLGNFSLEKGDFARAESLLKEADQIRRARLPAGDPEHAKTAIALGGLYSAMGDDARADALLRDAVKIREKAHGADHPLVAEALAEHAGVLASRSRYRDAADALERALTISKSALGDSHPTTMAKVRELAVMYHSLRQYDRARKLYQDVLKYYATMDGEDSAACAHVLHNLGMLFLNQGQYQEAEKALLRARAIERKFPASCWNTATQHRNLAQLYVITDRRREAIATSVEGMQEEQAILRSIFAFASESSMHLALVGMSRAVDRLATITVLNGTPTSEEAATTLTWILRRKGVVLDTLCRFRAAQRQLAQDSAIREQAARWQMLRQRMADAALNPPQGLDAKALKTQLDAWNEEAEKLETALNRRVSNQASAGQDVDVERVRARLAPGSVLVEIARVRVRNFKHERDEDLWKPGHYLAFILPADPKAPVTAIDLGIANDIDPLIATYRAELQKAAREIRTTAEKDLEADLAKAAAPLYRRLFAPLEKHLGSASMLYLAPDSELNRLPFEALPDAKGKYLVERYKIAYLASGRDLLRPAAAVAKGTVVFAGPDYNLKADDRQEELAKLKVKSSAETVAVRGALPALRGARWTTLPGAAAEAADVQKALDGDTFGPVQVYRGKAALEEVLKAMPAPRVLHLATHGFFLPEKKGEEESDDGPDTGAAAGLARLRKTSNPLLRSGIVLAGANRLGEEGARGEDGWVTAEEISLMDLRGTEFVVLSACETGLGDVKAGEGVFGLRRAFFFAGARTLVSSLFEVPDAQTREMMQTFYGGMKSGKSKLNALRDAQLAMIEKRRKSEQAAHPFFWASFVLIGDPR